MNNTTIKDMRQEGGKLLGKGVYGCTFYPAPRCAGGSVFRKEQGDPVVGKVVTGDVTNEYEIGRKIMSLPMARQYFSLPTRKCEANVDALLQEEPNADQCPILKDAAEMPTVLRGFASPEDYTVLAMSDSGTSLSSWAGKNMLRLADNYERIFVHLLEGMILYQSAGYVHNDIHHGNVLVDARNVARYIDFGSAFYLPAAKDFESANLSRRFRPEILWQAPEIHAWRMLINGIRLVDAMEQISAHSPEFAQLEGQFPGREREIDALANLLQGEPTIRSGDFGAFLQKYGFAIDWWRIGLSMWLLWDDLLHWPGIKQTTLWQQRRDVIRRVLGGMTEFDCRKRMSAKEALSLLDPRNRMSGSA
jgi:hypothetical protein